MSFAHDAGQMVFGCYEEVADASSPPSIGTLLEGLAASKIGGVLLSPSNLLEFTPNKAGGAVDVIALAAKIETFVKAAKDQGHVAPFIAADQEGGQVQRISPRQKTWMKVPDAATNKTKVIRVAVGTAVSRIPMPRDIGAKNDVTLTRDVASALASELRLLGFNLDFAPVADLGTGSGLIATAGRAYSTEPAVVTEMARATVEALTAAHIIPCIKHFPGHGATAADSHDEIARITKEREELDASDLLPFKQLASSVKMVMVGHLFVDDIDSTLPAVLSPKVITDVLRDEFGFTGVVITDDLFMMGARIQLNEDGDPLPQERTTEQIVKLGLDAGVDIFLSQKDWPAVYTTLVGLSTDPVYGPRIAQSATRVRALKSTIPDFAPSSTLVDDLKALVASHAETIARVNR